jgi:prepilin-type N-terminal cleavage/methylation domain-containing protein
VVNVIKSNRGFTLIELLAVIALISILVILAVPNILKFYHSSKISLFTLQAQKVYKEAENQIKQDIIRAEEKAIYSSTGANKLNVTVEKGIGYYVETINGKIIRLQVASKEYSIEKEDEDISIDEINNKLVKSSNEEGFVSEIGMFEYSDASGANSPIMASGMIPILWNGSKWVKANTKINWYDYTTKQWPNVVLVNNASRSSYVNAAPGSEILEADVLAYYVWIPRYKYKIPAGSNSREIDIVFEDGIPSVSNGDAITQYRTHPAFKFGAQELEGIWVSKFEMTGSITSPCASESCATAAITSKPGISSVRNQILGSFYYASRSIERSGNQYGLNGAKIDSHMIKGSEWGALTYLTQSVYGRCTAGTCEEVIINAVPGYYTGGGTGNSYQTNLNQSSTKNVTGVYDMNGGSYEFVMGNYNATSRDSGLGMGTIFPKYVDIYTTTSSTTACSGGICYGHALSETNGWYSDNLVFVTSASPWFASSGYRGGTSASGIFSSIGVGGGSDDSISTRTVIINEN